MRGWKYAFHRLFCPLWQSILEETRSPDGRKRAVVFERDCGTTDYSTQVSILNAQGRLAGEPGNVLIGDSDHEAARVVVGVRWDSPEHVVISDPNACTDFPEGNAGERRDDHLRNAPFTSRRKITGGNSPNQLLNTKPDSGLVQQVAISNDEARILEAVHSGIEENGASIGRHIEGERSFCRPPRLYRNIERDRRSILQGKEAAVALVREVDGCPFRASGTTVRLAEEAEPEPIGDLAR